MIKAIIFDFGNVICRFDDNIFLNKLLKYTNKSFEQLNSLIYDSGLIDKYESGGISSDETFEAIKKICGLSILKDEFIKAYSNIFSSVEDTIELIKKLKRNYKIGLLSNTNPWDFEINIKQVEIFDLFDAVSLSYEVGEKKPGKRMYMDILNKLKLKPDECVFVDDTKKNIEVASEIGLHGIHYTTHQKLVEKLKKLHITF